MWSGNFPDHIPLIIKYVEKIMKNAINTINNINLINNYYLKIVNEDTLISSDIIDIQNLQIINVLKNKKLILKIDFKNLAQKQYKKCLKKLLFIKNNLTIFNINLGFSENNKIIIGYIINYDENNKNQNDFILAINAILCNNRYERYNYIYDTVCAYLDSYFYGKNLCNFKNNKCDEKRNTSSTTGCCRHFKNKWLGPFSKLVVCEYLKEDYSCEAKCISCKLFTCNYLKKKGIEFKIKDILLLNVFFNPLQKYFLKYMVFTPKDKILKRLMLL